MIKTIKKFNNLAAVATEALKATGAAEVATSIYTKNGKYIYERLIYEHFHSLILHVFVYIDKIKSHVVVIRRFS